MNDRAEQIKEIRQMLSEAAKFMGVPVAESELRAMSLRLARYYGAELFSVILAIGNERYLPSGWDLENRVRAKLGKEPRKGLTEDIIEKNAEQLVKEGVAPEVARKGAAYMKRAIGIQPPPPPPPPAPAPNPIQEFEDGLVEAWNDLLLNAVPDPTSELEGFGEEPDVLRGLTTEAVIEDWPEESENPLADLENF